MPAARYWRIVGIAPYVAGGDLELGELQLYGGGARLDAPGMLACSHTPIGGTLATLSDGDPASACRFSGVHVKSGGFALRWDLGSSQSVDALRLAGGSARALYLDTCMLQYSADAANWTTLGTLGRLLWPGAYQMGAVSSVGDPTFSSTSLLLDMQGSAGSTALVDKSAAALSVTASGAVALSSARSPFGGTSGYFPGGTSDYASVPSSSGFAFGTGDFTIEAWIYLTAMPSGSYAAIADIRSTASGTGATMLKLDSAARLGVYSSTEASTSSTVPLNQWAHVEMARTAGTSRLFINGQMGASFADGDNKGANPCRIGRVYDNGHPAFAGYIGGLRIKKGVGLHAGDFSPPTGPWPLALGSGVEPRPVVSLPLTALQRAAAGSMQPFSVQRTARLGVARDAEFGGQGRIWGVNEVEIAPDTRVPTGGRVLLLRQRDKLVARQTWADPVTGAWEFTGLDTRQDFLALAEDLNGNYRPVAASRLTPEAA